MQIELPIAAERASEFGTAAEMEDADFHSIFDQLKSNAFEALSKNGELPAMVFMPTISNGKMLRMGSLPAQELIDQPMGKDILAAIIERLLEDPNHDFVIFAHEAWTLRSEAQNPEQVEKIQQAAMRGISSHPLRQEAAVFSIRSKNRQAIAILPMERSADGSFSGWGQNEGLIFPDAAAWQGRFAARPRP